MRPYVRTAKHRIWMDKKRYALLYQQFRMVICRVHSHKITSNMMISNVHILLSRTNTLFLFILILGLLNWVEMVFCFLKWCCTATFLTLFRCVANLTQLVPVNHLCLFDLPDVWNLRSTVIRNNYFDMLIFEVTLLRGSKTLTATSLSQLQWF